MSDITLPGEYWEWLDEQADGNRSRFSRDQDPVDLSKVPLKPTV